MALLPATLVPSSLLITVQTPAVTQGKNPIFDWKTGEFVKTATGRVDVVTGVESFKLWLIKALTTPRYRFPIYSEDFGNEVDSLIGVSLPDSIIFMELERLCREAIEYDERVKDVGGFNFVRQSDKVFLFFTVDTTQGVADIKLSMVV